MYRRLWEAGEWQFRPNEELITAGESMAAERAQPSGDRRLPRRSADSPWSRRPARLTGALAGTAAVLVVAVLWLGVERGERVSFDAAALAQVRRAVERATLNGPFIFPGTENITVAEAPVYRSAYVPTTDSLDAALSHLLDKYQRGRATADEAYWLVAGYTAVGRLEMAADLTRDVQKRFAVEARLLNVSAILAYEAGNRSEATRILDDVIAENPADSLARVNRARMIEGSNNSEPR